MSYEGAFNPHYGTGVLAAPTVTPSTINVVAGDKVVMFSNIGTVAVYFRITQASDTSVATQADCIVIPGERTLVTKPQDWTRISVVAASSTGSVHVICGEGNTSV